MHRTPFIERVERYLTWHQPTNHIPIHADDAEQAAKKYFSTFYLPFRVLGFSGTWGGHRDNA